MILTPIVVLLSYIKRYNNVFSTLTTQNITETLKEIPLTLHRKEVDSGVLENMWSNW